MPVDIDLENSLMTSSLGNVTILAMTILVWSCATAEVQGRRSHGSTTSVCVQGGQSKSISPRNRKQRSGGGCGT